MSDLDDKLKAILDIEFDYDYSDDLIDRIKQAFDAAGYVDFSKTLEDWRNENIMTGQEWLNRFNKEVPPLLSQAVNGEITLSVGEVYREAAKRASGLES